MKRIIGAVALIIILLLTGCKEAQISEDNGMKVEDEKPLIGGQLNIACIEPISFNPINVKNTSYQDIMSLFFNGLFEYDENMQIKPVLAEYIDIDEKTGKGVLKLKSNIYWSDGNKVSTKDIKVTIDMLRNSPDSIYHKSISHISSYKIVDEETININFAKPYYNLIEQLCFPIIPGHIYSLRDDSVPIGTGPYKVTDYQKLKYMILEPNEQYWHKEKPFIEKIKVLFVDDKYAFDPFFQSGEIDLLHASSYDWEKYKEQKDINTIKYISDGFEFILINHDNEILKDREVRQALMFGINKRAIVDKYMLGHVVLTDTPIKPGSWLDDGIGIKYNYSKTEAQYMLDKAGFSYSDNTRVYEREIDGKKQILRFTILTNKENEYRVKAAEDIKKSLEEAGIIIDLQIAPFEEIDKAIKTKKFDMILTGVNMKADYISYLHSSPKIGDKNYGSYANEIIDDLIDNIIMNQNNSYILIDDYRKLQEIMREDLPFLCLFYKENALVMRSKVSGTIKPDSSNLFRTIGSWYIVKKEADPVEKEE